MLQRCAKYQQLCLSNRVINTRTKGWKTFPLPCNTRFCVTPLVQFACHCTIRESGKGLEIEKTHKDTWVIWKEISRMLFIQTWFKLGEILIYLTAAQGPPPRQVGNYHTKNGVNALQLITRQGRGSTGTNKMLCQLTRNCPRDEPQEQG